MYDTSENATSDSSRVHTDALRRSTKGRDVCKLFRAVVAGAFHVELKYSLKDRYKKVVNGETLGQPLLIEGTVAIFCRDPPIRQAAPFQVGAPIAKR